VIKQVPGSQHDEVALQPGSSWPRSSGTTHEHAYFYYDGKPPALRPEEGRNDNYFLGRHGWMCSRNERRWNGGRRNTPRQRARPRGIWAVGRKHAPEPAPRRSKPSWTRGDDPRKHVQKEGTTVLASRGSTCLWSLSNNKRGRHRPGIFGYQGTGLEEISSANESPTDVCSAPDSTIMEKGDRSAAQGSNEETRPQVITGNQGVYLE